MTQDEAAEIIAGALVTGKDAGLDVRIGETDDSAVAQIVGWKWKGGRLVRVS